MRVRQACSRRLGICLLSLLAAVPLPASLASGQPLDKAMKAQLSVNSSDTASQKKIDTLAENTRHMLEEYKLVVRQTESLRVYNNHLERLIRSQKQELDSIDSQL